MSGGMPQFNLHDFAPQIAWMAFCFTALYGAVSRVILPAIDSSLQARAVFIDSALRDADDKRCEAEQMLAACVETENVARARTSDMLEKMRRDLARDSAEAMDALDRNLEADNQSALTTIAVQYHTALQHIDEAIAETRIVLRAKPRIAALLNSSLQGA